VEDRQAELPRQHVRLIEAAPQAAPRVQRHRYDAVGAGEEPFPRSPHERAERTGEYLASVVLEGLHDLAKRTVVFAGSARDVHERRTPPAPRAPFERHADHAPGRERITAGAAERGDAETDGAPAVGAYGAIQRPVEHRVTGGAAGRERGGQERV
jgi:hypothetical protein